MTVLQTHGGIHWFIHGQLTSIVSHSDTQRHPDTLQIDTTINNVLCSLLYQLGLVNDRLTTNWVSDCLFDSIPYNKLYEWIHRLLLLPLTLPSCTLRGYVVTVPSSLVIRTLMKDTNFKSALRMINASGENFILRRGTLVGEAEEVQVTSGAPTR